MNRAIRNIAIIAHVDHGKTTLVDKIIHACRLLKEHEIKNELLLDHYELERERGITIIAKNVAVYYQGVKINIIDTPGHADFGGEVERVLNMADAALVLVDAFEGPMPQTRYVLSKALSQGLKPLVVINKVDKENCRPDEVYEAMFELMFHLDATEEQLDFPVVYGSAKQGWMSTDWRKKTTDITPLLDMIITHVPPPPIREGSVQIQITSLEYSNYLGRIAIGRVARGVMTAHSPVSLIKRNGKIVKSRIKELYTFEGMGKIKVEQVPCGDLCAIAGIEGFEIGDTIADFEQPEALPPIAIDEPTISMLFTVNDSPFFGREGQFITSRHLRERLLKETEKNLALRVEETQSPDTFIVYGRGILHLSILIETMRREGYELQVGQPRVIVKEIDGIRCEPIEILTIDTPEGTAGKIIEQVTLRKGELLVMQPKGQRIHLEFTIPSRGLIGLRSTVLTLSQGEAIMAHRFQSFEPWRGPIPERSNGSLISMETGTAVAYAIDKLQDRGKFFIEPGEEVYAGQVIGEHNRPNDLEVNVLKTKKLTNIRAAGADEKMHIAPAVKLSLEEALEYIQKDEYVEVTPRSIRIRKILLDAQQRKRTGNTWQIVKGAD